MIAKELLTLPITEPVLLFAFLLCLILIVPPLFVRMRLPGLVGLLLAGVVVGPNGLNLVARGNTMILLGTIGLLYVIFIAGLEIDLARFKKYRSRSLVFGLLSYGIPQVFGTMLGLGLGFSWLAAILLGSILGSHTLLAYPIISKMGLGKSLPVTTAVGGSLLCDILAMTVLAVVAGASQGSVDTGFWFKLLGSMTLYVGVILWAVPRLGQWFFKNLGAGRDQEFIFALTTLFVVAFLARVAGIEPIIGAFLAGLTLNRLIPEHGLLMNRIKFVGNSLFIPFFLLATGMLVDVKVLLSEPDAWVVAGGIIGTLLLTKGIASWMAGAFYGYTAAERWVMFGLTTPQAAATLAATLVGLKLGLLTVTTVNGVIVMITVTNIIGPYLAQRFGRKVAHEVALHPERMEEAPERILVPIANPETANSLMDLALMIRNQNHHEPIFPLMAVKTGEEDVEAKVVRAEKMLSHAVVHAASVDIPVFPLTKVGVSVASAIAQASLETRTSIMVLGWNGQQSFEQKIFGGVIDQVLFQTSPMVFVSRILHPINTIRQVVVILPPDSEHHPGFLAATRKILQLCQHVSAKLEVWPVSSDGGAFGHVLKSSNLTLEVAYTPLGHWDELTPRLASFGTSDTLVVLFSPRHGGMSGQPILERLPNILANDPKLNFVVLYPSEIEPLEQNDPKVKARPTPHLEGKLAFE